MSMLRAQELEDEPACRKRIFSLNRPELPMQKAAWKQLQSWAQGYFKITKQPLPRPWIFSNEEGVIEFEWHLEDRHLILTMNGHFAEYDAWDDRSAEWTGRLHQSATRHLLLWVVTGAAPTAAIAGWV